MSVPSFQTRKLQFSFQLDSGQFSGANNTVTLDGHRATALITKAGLASMGGAEVTIYGMRDDQMAQLSTLGLIPSLIKRNTITIKAGDDVNGMSQVFQATIFQGWQDFSGAPDSCFRVTCFAGLIEAVTPIAASSYPGRVDAAQVMSDLAKTMNLKFENNGVSAILTNPYWPGTARQQVVKVAEAGNFNWVIDNGTLAIWPIGGSRAGSIPLISADTGLVGYPTFYSLGINVKTLFNPAIVYGSQVQVQSILKAASGTWIVKTLSYDLSADTPSGDWFQTMECSPIGY
jgi:hypothetical protein